MEVLDSGVRSRVCCQPFLSTSTFCFVIFTRFPILLIPPFSSLLKVPINNELGRLSSDRPEGGVGTSGTKPVRP